MWPFTTLKEYRSEIVETIRELDRVLCVEYLTKELIELGFTELCTGCFIYNKNTGHRFKVVFRVSRQDTMIPIMEVIHTPPDEPERKYREWLNLRTIYHVRIAYKILTGEPL